ncbi:MAG: hypothetical protein Q9214_000643 [Letrouitia sp. 1 TL-2023]
MRRWLTIDRHPYLRKGISYKYLKPLCIRFASSIVEGPGIKGAQLKSEKRRFSGIPAAEETNSSAPWISTIKRLNLPLSPLMNLDLISARQRYKKSPSLYGGIKLRASEAQALATPVRACAVTGARLPNYFLLRCGIARHPATNELWQMPKLAVDRDVINFQEETCSTSKQRNSTPLCKQPGFQVDELPPSASKPIRTFSSTHVVAQLPTLEFVSSLKQRSYAHFLSHRWRLDLQLRLSNIVWRKDMGPFVLNLMRRKVCKLLSDLSTKSTSCISKCDGYTSIAETHEPGAVLWLGEQQMKSSLREGNTESHLSEGPPPYAMINYKSQNIPIYNLPVLLGPKFIQHLRQSQPLFVEGLAVLKHEHLSVKVQMELWKLMGYITPSAGSNSSSR